MAVEEPLPADGDGDHLGPTRREALGHRVVARVFPGADEQPRPEPVPAHRQADVTLCG